jgi:GNAT superfamily N-acetyltransferase
VASIKDGNRGRVDDIVFGPPQPGDLGWIIHRHGALYAAEYGWDLTFEATVAGILGEIAGRLDPVRECILIARRSGRMPPGEAVSGDTVTGQTATGQTDTGETVAGQTVPGEILGSATLVRRSADEQGLTAQLRLVYVEPSARGLGLGRRLVDACLTFARAAGYRTVVLWTNDPLTSARALYASTGFRLVSAEPVVAFGKPMVSETWALDLV